MKEIKNKFGTGVIYDVEDLGKSIYAVCTACMSVWSDLLSYAVAYQPYRQNEVGVANGKTFLPNYVPYGMYKTDTIVVLGCQVTDLAILNDLETAEELHNKYPDVPIYMGGCLAMRFDIPLPNYLRRLNVIRKPYQNLDMTLKYIDYRPPFWNKNLKDDDDEFAEGNLFRHMYPLKIGAGCHGKCKYCTIRDTRGESYQTDAYLQVKEFLDHADEGIVLICDSPSPQQIKDWCHIATRYNKPISFRNVEPQTAIICMEELRDLAEKSLLKIFHCPIQSNSAEVLKTMNRAVEPTKAFINFAQELRKLGVKVATNIIIDYKIGDKVISNMPVDWLNAHFDYWSWNPYFDGNWDINKAKARFKKYITDTQEG